MVRSAQIVFKQEKQGADSHTCSCRMPGLSTSCKTIIIWVYYPHGISTCVKVPYNLEKIHTQKFLKNFNEKISMKFSITSHNATRTLSIAVAVTAKRWHVEDSTYRSMNAACTGVWRTEVSQRAEPVLTRAR